MGKNIEKQFCHTREFAKQNQTDKGSERESEQTNRKGKKRIFTGSENRTKK